MSAVWSWLEGTAVWTADCVGTVKAVWRALEPAVPVWSVLEQSVLSWRGLPEPSVLVWSVEC